VAETPRETAPRQVYESRLAERQALVERLTARDTLLSRLRGVLFVAGLVVWWLVAGAEWLPPFTLGLMLLAFLTLVVLHARALEARRRAERAVAFYADGLAHLAAEFSGRGRPGTRFLDEHHPFAADLDLFGPGSLYERLCRARTPFGEETLAQWLLEPSSAEIVRARHAAVDELRPLLDLRERHALAGEAVGAGVAATRLVAWGEAAPVRFPAGLRAVVIFLAAANVSLVTAFFSGALGAGPLLLLLAVSFGVGTLARAQVQAVVAGVDRPARDLALLAELLQPIEAETFTSPRLQALQRALTEDGLSASAQIARLARLMDLLESRRNQLFAPVAALVFWSTQLALSIEGWRRRCGPRLGSWVAAVGEFEALLSLSGYAFEHPTDPFPELTSDEDGPCYDGRGLAHPLLPEERAVRNDLRLDGQLRLLMISGSNMSGKSTLLRTVGTNLVLAWAGAPVRAQSLVVSRLALGASLRVNDSLQQGASRFYAEITRLRQIMDLARERAPLLFLLDEILHGTNSSDRRVGAEAVVRGLLARDAIGLVTTHDLALAQLGESLAPQARNVHFEDHVEDGRIAFDYRMHPGVVTRSNAVALMRAVGLPV
jgi:MutS domain V